MIFFLGSSFQTSYICKPIENPYHQKGGWMGDHAHVCFIVKIIVNLNMKWVVGIWDIHLILLLFQLVSLNSFNLVSILTSFCILIYVLFHICMLTLHIVSISIGIYFLHTYIDDLFVLIISLYLKAQILAMLSLSFSIGILIQALS